MGILHTPVVGLSPTSLLRGIITRMEKFTEESINEVASPKKSRHWINLIVTVLVLGILVLFVSRDFENIRAYIAASGWIGLLVSLVVYGLLGLSPIPSEPLTVLLGSIFGPFYATLAAGMGNLLAALVEYFLGTRISAVADFETHKEKLPFGLGRFPVNSAAFLMGARLVPGFGSKLVSVVGGVYRVPILRYIWTAAIPIFAGSAIFAFGGAGLFQLFGR